MCSGGPDGPGHDVWGECGCYTTSRHDVWGKGDCCHFPPRWGDLNSSQPGRRFAYRNPGLDGQVMSIFGGREAVDVAA